MLAEITQSKQTCWLTFRKCSRIKWKVNNNTRPTFWLLLKRGWKDCNQIKTLQSSKKLPLKKDGKNSEVILIEGLPENLQKTKHWTVQLSKLNSKQKFFLGCRERSPKYFCRRWKKSLRRRECFGRIRRRRWRQRRRRWRQRRRWRLCCCDDRPAEF